MASATEGEALASGYEIRQSDELKPYDVRSERERGRRKHLRQAVRRVLRVTTLLSLDAAVLTGTLAALLAALRGSADDWSRLAPPVVPVLLLGLLLSDAYGPGRSRQDSPARGKGLLLGCAVLALLGLLPGSLPLDTGFLALFGLAAFLGLELERGLVQRAVLALRRRGLLVRRALMVAPAAEADALAAELSADTESDLRIVGRVDPEAWTVGLEVAAAAPLRVVPAGATPGFEELERALATSDAAVVVLGASLPDALAYPVVARAFEAGASVLSAPSPGERAAARLGAVPALDPTRREVHPPRFPLPELGLKRGLDLLLAAAGLVVLSPLLVVLAVAVKLDSPGPVLFRQVRLGVGGRPFRILKFRTMVDDAERRRNDVAHLNQYRDTRLFKAPADPRVTRVGRVLRRTSLDELPQLLNVLRGEMSLVGPRPPLPEEVSAYAAHELVRLAVVPGITGPWQANGRSDVLDFSDVVRLEREYIRDWSLWLDLRILMRTLLAVVRGVGAR